MTGPPHCRVCEEELPQAASFCPACGTARAPEPPVDLETCEIVWWRGYVKSGFYAVHSSSTDDVSEEPLASPLFRTKRGQPPAEAGEAREAHRALVERLLTEGWEIRRRGSTWYSQTFVRRPSVPDLDGARAHVHSFVEEPAPEVPEAVPEDAPQDDASDWRNTEIVLARTKRRVRVGVVVRGGVVVLVATVAGVSAAAAPSLLSSEPAQGNLRAANDVAKQNPKTKAAQPVARQPARPIARQPARPIARQSARPIAQQPARIAHVALAATRGDSWVEARAGSSAGRVLYTGMLVQGQTERVSAKRVWLRLAAAGHLDLLVNGRPPREGPLLGTLDVVLGPGSAS
jgi:hypothetical protein